MAALRRSTRDAEDFARALNSGRAARTPELAGLVALTSRLQAMPQAPVPAFRAGLRAQLVGHAGAPAGSMVPTYVRAPRSRRPYLRLLATGGLATTTAFAGMGVAASRSLPGDPFYGVKQATERVQVALAGSEYAKGVVLLRHARERLDEVQRIMTGAPGPLSAADLSHLQGLLSDLDRDLRRSGDRLIGAARDGSDGAAYALSVEGAQAQTLLVALVNQLPGSLHEQALATAGRLAVTRSSLSVLPDATGPASGQLPIVNVPAPSAAPVTVVEPSVDTAPSNPNGRPAGPTQPSGKSDPLPPVPTPPGGLPR